MTREAREFGDTVYTSQCATLTHCENLKGDVPIIGRSLIQDTRSLTEITCHKCCHDDLCNAHCRTKTDYCASNPCVHGRCINGVTGYTCVCDQMYNGLNCSEADYCASNPCVHGRCVNGMTGYTCVCDPLFKGHNCSERDYCASKPCVHGRCNNIGKDYACVCDGLYTGHNCSEQSIKDCLDERNFTQDSGVYRIQPHGSNETINIYCDMTTDGGGWTVFQRRVNGSVDFYQNFSTYEKGFGDVHGEFWLGLKYIYSMTFNIRSELRIELVAADGSTAYEVFQNFRLSAAPNYTLHIDRGNGTAGDVNYGLSWHNGHNFSTYDNNNDRSCARNRHGGWWYDCSAVANLNGQYLTPGTTAGFSDSTTGITYYDFKHSYDSLKETKLMFRRV